MSISDMDFQDVDIPQGAFIGWGEIGQTITGKVVSFAPEGGTDFNNLPCPQLVLELVGDAVTFKDKGTVRDTIDGGEFATITAGQANLKRSLLAASLNLGDTVRIRYDADYKTAKGTGKSFKVQVARGSGPVPPKAAPAGGVEPF